MSGSYPNDADGDAMRRVAALGADLSHPMRIDFHVAVPDQQAGEAIARLAILSSYQTKLVHDDEDDDWTCWCTKAMRLTYDGVVEAQRELDDLSRQFGGYSDGWGTSGNAGDA